MYLFIHLTLVPQRSGSGRWDKSRGVETGRRWGLNLGLRLPAWCRPAEISVRIPPHPSVHNSWAISVFHQSSGNNSVLNSDASWIRVMASGGIPTPTRPEGCPSCHSRLQREQRTPADMGWEGWIHTPSSPMQSWGLRMGTST